MGKFNKSHIINSIKWSGLGEIGVKLISPISTMILARLLTPEHFGIVAVCSMITSFSEIIADAGFSKYIIQADFSSNKELISYVNVAFWSHFGMSLVLSAIIIFFSSSLATLLGIAGHEVAISIASLQLIVMSVVNTQLAILRRQLEYKKVFISRLSSVLASFVITIPIAFLYRTYWAIIIGSLGGYIINIFVLFFLTKWVPSFSYNWFMLKNMFQFSFWSLCEGLMHWVIFWFDIFIVASSFTTYDLGLYKNSTHIMLSFIGMITATMSPVLLSILSRLKFDADFNNIYTQISKLFMYLVLPICIGIYFFRDFVTLIILGDKWMEASEIIGAWALMLGISVFIYSFPAEIFKSKGIPKVLFFYQLAYLFFLIPICVLASQFGFWTFVHARTLSIIIQIIIFVFFVKKYLSWNLKWMWLHYKSILLPVVSIFGICYFVQTLDLQPVISSLTYLLVFLLYAGYFLFFKKDELLSMIRVIGRKKVI